MSIPEREVCVGHYKNTRQVNAITTSQAYCNQSRLCFEIGLQVRGENVKKKKK